MLEQIILAAIGLTCFLFLGIAYLLARLIIARNEKESYTTCLMKGIKI